VDPVSVKRAAPVRYVSRSEQLGAASIDAYVRDMVAALRREHEAVPTADGDNEIDAQEVAFTVARGDECEYPQILAAYDAVVAFASSLGRELDGAPREVYLVDPGSGTPAMEVAFALLP